MFITDLYIRALMDKDMLWELTQDLVWESPTESITVPAGFITDLASIPPVFRGILRQNGRSRRAGVLHDFLYKQTPIAREIADKLFFSALVADRMSRAGRWAYYLGVRLGGFLPFNRYRRQM